MPPQAAGNISVTSLQDADKKKVDEDFWAPPKAVSAASARSEQNPDPRIEFLKGEIKKFLRDKKLLAQLEAQSVDHSMRSGVSNSSTTILLLKDEIKRQSSKIEPYLAELKSIKSKNN